MNLDYTVCKTAFYQVDIGKYNSILLVMQMIYLDKRSNETIVYMNIWYMYFPKPSKPYKWIWSHVQDNLSKLKNLNNKFGKVMVPYEQGTQVGIFYACSK